MAYGVGRMGTWVGMTSAMVAAAVVVTVAPMGTAPASVAAPANPCHALKAAEIEKAFGKDVGSPSRNDGLCAWDLAGGIGKKGGGSVEVEVDNGPAAAQNFEGFATAGEAIAGLGDRAFYGPGYQSGFNLLKGAPTFASRPRSAFSARSPLLRGCAASSPSSRTSRSSASNRVDTS